MQGEHGRCRISPFLTAGWSKAGYIVPCDLLAEVLEAHKAEFEDEDRSPEAHEGQATGWRQGLADRAAQITGRTAPAVFRRLYDVMYGRTKAVNIDMAEGMLLACGLMLDRDTDLPTLPSNMHTAREMAELHAEFHAPDMTPEDIEAVAKSLFHFAHGYVLFDIGEQAAQAVGDFLIAAGRAMAERELERELAAELELVAA